MSDSHYTSFAVWGAGNLGARLVTQLLEHQPQRVTRIIVLSRPDSMKIDDGARKGVIYRAFDAHSEDATQHLADVDVLIATTSFGGLPLQHYLIRAAVKAGVKLFVPSEWGDTTDGRTEGIFMLKQQIRMEAKQLGLPTATFWTGPWIEWLEKLGFDLQKGTITIHGKGDALISMTSIDDVARFAAYVLTRLPRDQLEDRTFLLEGDLTSLNGLAASLQLRSARVLDIQHITRAQLERKLTQDPDDIVTSIFLGWDLGKGRHLLASDHGLLPGWQPKSALSVLTLSLPGR